MADPFDYDQLDPGIRDVVRAIHEWGWKTCDSGDGSKAGTMECALDHPHVFCEAKSEHGFALNLDAHALAELLIGRFGPGWYVEASYSTKDGKAFLYAMKDAPAIDTGDVVRHGPTGEEWLVAYVDGQHLAWCGWPSGHALVSDCTLVKKATPEERIALLRQLATSQHPGRTRAQRALEREGVAPTVTA